MSIINRVRSVDAARWVEYEGIEGFEVQLHYITREELTKIRDKCLVIKFNQTSRQREETLDGEKFIKEYASRAILDWKGLKMKNLPELLPVDISDDDPEQEIPFNIEEAEALLRESNTFDQWVTDCMNDFEKFSKSKREENEKN